MNEGLKDLNEILVKDNCYIQEPLNTYHLLVEKTGKTFDFMEMIQKMRETDGNLYYLSQDLELRKKGDHDIIYCYMDTGLRSIGNEYNDQGERVVISLLTAWDRTGSFHGKFVGCVDDFLYNAIKNSKADRDTILYNAEIVKDAMDGKVVLQRNTKKNTSAKGVYSTDFIKEIKELLAYNPFATDKGLRRYVIICGCRAKKLVEEKQTEYYIVNNNKGVVINTGLSDKFGQDLRVIYRMDATSGTYEYYKLVGSKNNLIAEGFSAEDVAKKLKTIKAIRFGEEYHLPTTEIDDFDLTAQNLRHIFEDNMDRIKEAVGDNVPPLDKMADSLKRDLEYGLSYQRRDPNFAKAYFSTREKSLSYLLPFHVNRSYFEQPELLMVIRKSGEFYEIKTVLPYDEEMKDKITCLNLYGNMWN